MWIALNDVMYTIVEVSALYFPSLLSGSFPLCSNESFMIPTKVSS